MNRLDFYTVFRPAQGEIAQILRKIVASTTSQAKKRHGGAAEQVVSEVFICQCY
jgi:hypothetical protein